MDKQRTGSLVLVYTGYHIDAVVGKEGRREKNGNDVVGSLGCYRQVLLKLCYRLKT